MNTENHKVIRSVKVKLIRALRKSHGNLGNRPVINCRIAQHLFNPNELVIFGEPV